MDKATQDILELANAQSKVYAFAALCLCHFLCGVFNFYTFSISRLLVMVTGSISLAFKLQASYPRIGRTLNSIILGSFAPLFAVAAPEHFTFAVHLHFMGLNYAFGDTKWQYMPFLFGSNTLCWIYCGIYYKYLVTEASPDILAVKEIFNDRSKFYQVFLGLVVNLAVFFLCSVERYINYRTLKRYEHKLVLLNRDLEETNKKLQNSNKELQEALQEKENFILRFSHEIRNPLNSLLGNVELCNEQTVDKELGQMLQDAKVSGEILLQLLNNVLDTAKVSAGRLEVSLSNQNIRNFLEKAWIICSEILRKKRLYGCLSVNMNVPEIVEFDHHRMMQILINTISNAAKFTEQGYVKIYVDFVVGSEIKNTDLLPKYNRTINGELKYSDDFDQDDISEKPQNFFQNLTIVSRHFREDRPTVFRSQTEAYETPYMSSKKIVASAEEEILSRKDKKLSTITNQRHYRPICGGPKQGYIRFEIVDSGCGMQQKDVENIFKKFQQVGQTSSKRQIGTGLGLWITKEIIEMMNGKIEIYSRPNRGTVIVIMVKTNLKYPSSPKNNELNGLSSFPIKQKEIRRVLVVEDIEYNQEVNRRLLQKCNIKNIMIANNGQEAVEMFLSAGPQYFDLIIMDIDMPVMDGKTAVKIIRREENKRKWTPVNIVLLTGFAESKTQKEVLDRNGEYRANGFYSKPASLETLRSILKNASAPKESGEKSVTPLINKNGNISSSQNICLNLKEIPKDRIVLVVDDDSFNLEMLVRMIKLCGLNAIEARNAKEAFQLYEENWKKLHCILMDCEMPVMDGLEATRKILERHRQRAAITGRKMVIYGLTGNVGKEYQDKCLEAGMKDVLEKPININILNSLLKN